VELEARIMVSVIEVPGGRVRGVHRHDHWSFSGIPYAASPAGSARFRPPAPPEPWSGVRSADRFGPIAPQNPSLIDTSLGGRPEPQSEDCLSLNIWTPGLDGDRRPVMVWIHGGSFVWGSGSGGLYRGGTLAREGDVVVVTINYRLGLLGFLAHPALGDPDQSWLGDHEWTGFGNWGLADQVAALRWVRDHIADFGGDPGNVTLFGESAGGMSVTALLAAPAARGLFHRAIVESGGPYALTPDQAASTAEQLAGHLGVPVTREALERVPTEALVRAVVEFDQRGGRRGDSGLLMMPVVDGGLLSVAPDVAVATGSAAEVPLLIGTTRDEMAFFTIGDPALSALDPEGLRRWMRRLTPDPEAVESVIAQVTGARLARGEPVTPRDLWVAIATEYIFRLPSVRLADAHAAAARPGVGTYSYLFTWESPMLAGYLGSCHALEIPFVFGTVHNPAIQGFAGGGADALGLSAAMRALWTSFARTGSPGTWPAWDPDVRPTQILGPWPGRQGWLHRVDGPRPEELEAVAAAVGPAVAP
jgi:para-nitrobenzyl esterase